MTGTAALREEFLKVYGLDVIVIPTNRQLVRVDHNRFNFSNRKRKISDNC